MDADAHRRAAKEDEAQIEYWNNQIEQEQRDSQTRIENFRTEIENHKRDMKQHLETAVRLEREAEKHDDKMEVANKIITRI